MDAYPSFSWHIDICIDEICAPGSITFHGTLDKALYHTGIVIHSFLEFVWCFEHLYNKPHVMPEATCR